MIFLLDGGAGFGDVEGAAGGGVRGVGVGPGLVGGELEVAALVLELVEDGFDFLAQMAGFVGDDGLGNVFVEVGIACVLQGGEVGGGDSF